MIQVSFILVLFLSMTAWCSSPAPTSKPLTYRTSLHVARSLNPESMEHLSVKTKSGDVATIIVKKREGGRNMRNFWTTDENAWRPISPGFSELNNKPMSLSQISGLNFQNSTIEKNDKINSNNVSQTVSENNIQMKITPSYLQNSSVNIPKNTEEIENKKKLLESNPELNKNESFSRTRFGSINSSPYPSEKSTQSVQTSGISSFKAYPIQTPTNIKERHSRSNLASLPSEIRNLIPAPITITSMSLTSSVNNNNNEEDRQSRKLHVDPDGIPVITGIRVPDDESDRQVWRNARVINGILVPYAKNHLNKYPQKGSHSQSTIQPTSAQWLKMEHNQKKPLTTIIKENGGSGKWSEKKILPTNPAPLNVMLIEEQDDKWQKLGSITTPNNQPKENHRVRPNLLWMRDDVRQNQDENYVSDKILNYIKQINQHESSHRLVRKVEERDAKAFLEEEAASRNMHPRAISRVSENKSANLYSSSSTSPPRISFEGVRTPVLQYAHPELGVQPAKVGSTVSVSKDNELEPMIDSRAQALAYFAHDIHADRSPFAFEPGLEEEARVQESLDAKPMKPSTRPKKNLAYPSAKYVNPPDSHYNKYEYSSKYPFSYKGYGGYYSHIHEPEKPMWKKISDTVKDHVQNGIEKVSNLTRPVVEPLVEATHKISQNLGLSSGNRDLNTIKEKVGLAGGSSILLPALGLVAGGAALGLGAVAVGRYLHMDVTHMRSQDQAMHRNLNEIVTLVNSTELIRNVTAASEPSSENEEKKVTRRKRSSGNEINLENTPISDFILTDEQKQFLSNPHLWKNSGCTNKIFCEIMIAQPQESHLLLENKMMKYIKSLHSSLTQTMLPQVDSVMTYVRRRNCAQLVCSYRT